MTYVKPSTTLQTGGGPQASSDSEILVVDGNGTGGFGQAVQAANNGYGVVGTDGTNTFEILDALPLGRTAVQESIERASNIDFAAEDFLTSGEINSLDDGNYQQAGSDQT